MDSAHDLGGRQGFGPVVVEPNEPAFHAPWERRTFGLTAAMSLAGLWNMGRFRHAIERMDPVHYLGSAYYEHWLTGVTTLLVEEGVIDHDELERRIAGSFPLARPLLVGEVAEPGADRTGARFAVGDNVRVVDAHSSGHTRCPSYIRGRPGTVVRVDGCFSLPDVEAHSSATRLEPTYSVRFALTTLWGSEADPAGSVCVDLWESYLEPSRDR
jgi:nitrile hydratase beta subunit